LLRRNNSRNQPERAAESVRMAKPLPTPYVSPSFDPEVAEAAAAFRTPSAQGKAIIGALITFFTLQEVVGILAVFPAMLVWVAVHIAIRLGKRRAA
jgi:hypothetical protein